MDKKIDLKLWFLIVFSLFLIMYSFIYLYNYYGENDILLHFPDNYVKDGETTKSLHPNEIGDSIGGILNPVIGFTAAILTFLAFYIQYKSNSLQIELFNRGLKEEQDKNFLIKTEQAENEKNNHETNIKIFRALLNSLLQYYDTTGNYLDAFIKKEKDKPLEPNIFNGTVNSSYQIFQSLDFTDLYKSVKFHFINIDEDWEEQFISVLSILEYYDKAIKELREKYSIHISKKVETLNYVGSDLNKVMGDVLLNNSIKNLNGIAGYFRIVHRIDENGERINEDKNEGVDFESLQDEFFAPYLTELKRLFDKNQNSELKSLLENLSILNKQIGSEKFQSIYYVENISGIYTRYFSEDNKNMSIVKDFVKKLEIDASANIRYKQFG